MPASPILGVSLITLAYTSIGGLPVSILTDRIQAVIIFFMTLIILIATYAYATGWDEDRFADAAGHGVHPIYNPTDYGNSIAIAISLIMGVTCANMFHAGYWQRVWAAESNEVVKKSTYLASALSFCVMILMGVVGWVAYGHYGSNLILPGVFDITFLSAPWLINDFMGGGWAAVTLIFVISMISSTADTLQSGMTALLWPAADKLLPSLGPNAKMAVVVCTMCLINVPAIIVALSGQSILQLFLLADLVAACAVAPLFLALWERITPVATIVGSLSGIATLLIIYAIGETWDEGYNNLVEVQGGIFKRSAAYAFCLVPFFSGVVTVGVSMLDKGYKFAGYADTASTTKGVEMNQAEGGGISSI
jgi:Na+/proline symporter